MKRKRSEIPDRRAALDARLLSGLYAHVRVKGQGNGPLMASVMCPAIGWHHERDVTHAFQPISLHHPPRTHKQRKGCFQPCKTRFFWMVLTQAAIISPSTLFAACVVTTSWQQILDTRILSIKAATVNIFSQLKLMWVMEASRKTQNLNIKRKLP